MVKLKVEVADEPYTLARGLMFRNELPKGNGMLFKFPTVLEASFWGKNTYIPLDVAFVGPDHRISNIAQVVPMSTKAVRSDNMCLMAIEANAGFFDEHGIKTGHRVELAKDHDDQDIEVIFHLD